MLVERTSGTVSFVEALDRVLDKGVVVDAWRVTAAAGIDLISVRAKVVVASIETYLSLLQRNRVLFIIAANRRVLLDQRWLRKLTAWAHVIRDRRRSERRRRKRVVLIDRRQVQRRTHDVNRDLRSMGLAAVVLS